MYVAEPESETNILAHSQEVIIIEEKWFHIEKDSPQHQLQHAMMDKGTNALEVSTSSYMYYIQ